MDQCSDRLCSIKQPRAREDFQKILCHAIVHFEATDTSIKTAQDGYDLSCDAIELCGHLLDPDIELTDFQEYISHIQSKVKQAREDSMMTLNLFIEVQKRLILVRLLRHCIDPL